MKAGDCVETVYGVAKVLWIDLMVDGAVYNTTLGKFTEDEVTEQEHNEQSN